MSSYFDSGDSLKLNVASLNNFAAQTSKYQMVYGFKHCKYDLFKNGLQDGIARGTIQSVKGVFDNFVVKPASTHKVCLSGEKRQYNVIDYVPPEANQAQGITMRCVAGLADTVVENYKRSIEIQLGTREPQSEITIPFLLDADGNPHPLQVTDIASEDPIHSGRITNQELRAAWQLSHAEETPLRLQEVAQRSIVPAKLAEEAADTFGITPLQDNPLNSPELAKLMQKPLSSTVKFDWMPQAIKEIDAFDDEVMKAHPEACALSFPLDGPAGHTKGKRLTIFRPSIDLNSDPIYLAGQKQRGFFQRLWDAICNWWKGAPAPLTDRAHQIKS